MNNIAQNFKDNLLNTGHKLIYPNSKKIELRIFAKNIFTLVKKAQNTRLTLIQTVSNWNQLFLREDYYKFIKTQTKMKSLLNFLMKTAMRKSLSFLLLKYMMKKECPITHYLSKKLKKFI